MARRTLNIVLLAALLTTLLLNWKARPNSGRPNFDFLPGLVHTPRSNAYSENATFADGMTLREPVSGTIRRNFPPLHFTAASEDAVRAGIELQSPVPSGDEKASKRGAIVYGNFCQPCHGSDAAGNGPVVQRGFPAPPSLLAENAKNLKDGQLFHVITYGQKNMPGHASLIGREDRWKAIAYLRSLQSKPSEKRTSVPQGGQP